jgi:uncharacterized integral membrane protein (TIGR00697 family)
MPNEAILFITLILENLGVVVVFRLFGNSGLRLWTVMATITYNIEVLILVDAFGLEMTLGNILFATTFLVTDITSEVYGKKESQKTVWIGIATAIIFVLISGSWLYYTPSANDFASPAISTIFAYTPRLVLSSMAVYAIAQFTDVWLYHKWWDLTDRIWGDHDRFLWVRNNGSTLISQLINSVLFNVFAFAGIYETKTLISIILSCYLIFIVTSLFDTPFMYLCRKMSREGKIKDVERYKASK